VADFQEVYGDLVAKGQHIISIHVSGKLSGTLNSAEQARASLGGPVPIEIIDSQLASMGLGLVVLAAAQLAHRAMTYQQVAQQVRQDLSRTHALFLLDTLEYLQKGGRIGKAQAFVGSLLNVKPLLKLQDGEVHPVERPRNRERGLRRMVGLVRELAPARQLAVIHSTEPEQAERLRQQLADLLPESEIIISRFGPTLGTYVGPKALGVAVTSSVVKSDRG
jgi:DegV family protein with EDD domain